MLFFGRRREFRFPGESNVFVCSSNRCRGTRRNGTDVGTPGRGIRPGGLLRDRAGRPVHGHQARPDRAGLPVFASLFSGNVGVGNGGQTLIDRSVIRFNQDIINVAPGGGVFNAAGTVTVRRSLINRNVPDDCAPPNTIAGCTG